MRRCRFYRKCNYAVAVLLVLLLHGLVGCSTSGPVERSIVRLIREQCRNQIPCQIRIEQATTFSWDKMYAFKYTATSKDREAALGIKDEGYRELERQLVFLSNGRIVYQESEPTNVEHLVKNEVVFDMPDEASFSSYPKGTVFSANEQRSSESGPYYRLAQLK